MSIKHWPAMERPREKLLHQGAQSLSDAELLAIFLRTGTAGKSAVQLARELLQNFGNLKNLLAADQHSFCQAAGLGPAKYAQLQAVLEMGSRHYWQELQSGPLLGSPQQVQRFVSSRLDRHEHEVFACLYLDNRHHVLAFEELFRGTLNQASVYPREVVKQCLKQHAAALIIAHNHPSGHARPSAADRYITAKLAKALALVDIDLLDHVIIAGRDWYSFAQHCPEVLETVDNGT